MRIIFIVILLGLLLLQAPPPKVEAIVPACPAGYEEGYVWGKCFQYLDGCYGIRDNETTNSIILCPLACCQDYNGGQYVSLR